LRTGWARGALLAVALATAIGGVASGCAAKRFLGFGGGGTLLVRHHEHDPQEIWLEGDLLGVADSGVVRCFREIQTGTVRIEARASNGALTRATSAVLPPEQARLWDVDYDQVLEGRAFLGVCN
jgi:hypothetical protein